MMKKIIGILLTIMLAVILVGCNRGFATKPDIMQVRSSSKFATMKCYYHNVAKATKTPESGISHIGEKTRKFWIEYNGIVTLGIDFAKVKMTVDGENVSITIPAAQVLSVDVDYESYNADSFIESEDGWNSNVITAEDAKQAVTAANQQMHESVKQNDMLLRSVQERAKVLINNYIVKLGELTNTTYNISWDFEDNIVNE